MASKRIVCLSSVFLPSISVTTCQKSCANLPKLILILRLQVSTRPYRCAISKAGFKQQSELTAHKRVECKKSEQVHVQAFHVEGKSGKLSPALKSRQSLR